MGVIPNPKMAFIFPISCILALIFPIFIKYFPKYEGKGSFPKSQIKSLFHGIRNTWGLLQSSFEASLTLQETRSIHDSMNIPKIEFIS